jgi:PKD repeat protein
VSHRIRAIAAVPIPPQPPVGPDASFTFAPTGQPRQMLYTGVGAYPSYSWELGDGRTEGHSSPTCKHTYAADGTYAVKLTVTDAAGLVNSSTQSVPVGAVIPIPPDPIPVPPDPTMPADEVWAKPPVIYIDSKLPTVTGKTIPVPMGGNLQAALDNAQPCDEITLAMGSKFVANYDIPAKAGTQGWIIIRPDNMAALPPEGTRRTRNIPGMPIVHSVNNLGVFTTKPGAARYRFIGIEGAQPANIPNTGFFRLGVSETSLNDIPREIVLDRVWLHGYPTGNFRRAVLLNGASISVIDSILSDCHEHGSDSQSLGGWNGPGPFKIVNCELEAASENVIFGGSDPSIPNLIPGDVEIRRCHILKNLSWVGQQWNVKNLWEMKNAQRVLMEACVLENVWADGQVGYSTNLKSVNQGGTAPWCTSRDVMMRYCIVRNVGAGFNLIGCDPGATIPSERITIMHVLVDGMFPAAGQKAPNGGLMTGDGRGVQVLNNPIDAAVIHCTILSPHNTSISFGGPVNTPPKRFVYRDNISGNGQYGVKGPGLNTADTFKAFMADGKYKGNVLIGPDGGSSYPAGTSFAPTEADVGFMSATDRRLAASSKYKGKATDGTDPGADVAKIMSMTAGVV